MEKVLRPDDLIYAVDERPPLAVLLVLALQHVFVMSSTLILPVVILQEIGGSFAEIRSVVSLSMIAAGIGTILQSLGRGCVGSGYLVPNLCGPSFLSVSVHAAWIGGLPLMRGMTIVAGLFELFFSRVISKLRVLFPVEITGLVVVMVAVMLVPLGASKFVGIDYAGDRIQPAVVLTATITLAIMIGVNVMSRGRLKLYSVLIGMAAGYLLSLLFGIISSVDLYNLMHAPLVDSPIRGLSDFKFSFDLSLLVPFLIVSLCGSLKTFGNLVIAQKANDASWEEANIGNIGNGLFADGLSVISAGLLGGMATDSSASNVGMSLATRATSRWIGFIAGALFILLAFFPQLSSLISIMPDPVMGAILIFVISFMVLSGLQIIIGSGIDTRKIFVIGVPFALGLSVDILPELYAHVPMWLAPLFESSLTLATLLAVALNQILRLRR